MENASKALLIAGAILIAIVLIAMGVRVISSTQGTQEATETTMKSTEMAMFNNKFTAYAGSGKTGAQVMSLANLIIASNANNPTHIVEFNGETDPNSIIEAAVNYQSGGNEVRINYSNDGYVNAVTVEKTN